MINEPKIVEIKEIIDETPTIKTFKFDWDMETLGRPNPGEFVMVWNFKNEKPMSIAQINDNELAITVKNIGEFTSQLHNLKIGDKIGVRGSYGNGFNNSFEGKNILDVISQYNMFSGGGCSVPDWGLGVMYRAYTKYTGEEIKKLADYFRENDIPCDIIGLEPG